MAAGKTDSNIVIMDHIMIDLCMTICVFLIRKTLYASYWFQAIYGFVNLSISGLRDGDDGQKQKHLYKNELFSFCGDNDNDDDLDQYWEQQKQPKQRE